MREGLTMARFMCEVNVDMCVEGRLKQEKIQGCWFVDGKVPSIRMQVKWETFFSDKCFFKQCDRVGKTNTNLYSL